LKPVLTLITLPTRPAWVTAMFDPVQVHIDRERPPPVNQARHLLVDRDDWRFDFAADHVGHQGGVDHPRPLDPNIRKLPSATAVSR
jgi:hypothetical protein